MITGKMIEDIERKMYAKEGFTDVPKRGMRILALDMATKTGWAMKVSYGLESGVQDFTPKRGESSGMRYLMFRRWLYGMSEGGIDLIVYEQNFRRGGHASEVAAGFSTRVQELCAENRIEHAQVNVLTLKKWATGSGRAEKPAMIAAACKFKWPTQQPATWRLDDNEADAILLLQYAIKEIVGGGMSLEKVPADAVHL